RLFALAKPCAERQQRNLAALADDAAFADFERNAGFGHLDAATFAARVAYRARPIVDGYLRGHHVNQLSLVGSRHDHKVRQAAEIGIVERTGMRRAVGADEAGAVDGKTHGQALDRHVMDDLVIAALKEGRVDRTEWLVALGGETRSEGNGVLFGDADVECTGREGLGENVDTGTRRHCSGNADDRLVLFGFLDEALT